MLRMTVVVEMADGSPPVGAAAAAGYPAARGNGMERRSNERRGCGGTVAPPPAGARPYGFRSFRDRRKGAGEPTPAPAEPGTGHTFRAAPIEDRIRVRVAAAYGDDGEGASLILHQIDLCL